MNAAVDTLAFVDRASGDLLARAAAAFAETRDPAGMFVTDALSCAREGLLQLARQGNAGSGLVTGLPGVGKSLLRTVLQRQADPARCTVVVVEQALLQFDDLLLEILSQLRGERLMTAQLPGRYERLSELKSVLATDVVAGGRHLLLLLDDAEQLEASALEGIVALTNLCSDRQAFVVPVFIGQPALRQKLARLPVLHQRIGAQFAIRSLTADETVAYLEHRLELAGVDPGRVLDPAVATKLHAASGGTPRVINALCRHAFRDAADRGLRLASAASLEVARSRLPEPAGSLSPVTVGQ